jgi:hypothetical protein
MSLDLLDANLHRPVPAWMHDLARTTGADALRWAGRNDCPAEVVASIVTEYVTTVADTSTWRELANAAFIAALVTARDDLDPVGLAAVTTNLEIKASLTMLAENDPGCLVPLSNSGNSWYTKEFQRFGKNLVALRKSAAGAKPVSMTQLTWTAGRGHWVPDALVARCASELVKNGTRDRLVFALAEIAGRSEQATWDLGYLCRHHGAHGRDDSCLYQLLSGFDAHAMTMYARKWVVPWLDSLEPEPRRVAMAMLASGARGSSLGEVASAAEVVLA